MPFKGLDKDIVIKLHTVLGVLNKAVKRMDVLELKYSLESLISSDSDWDKINLVSTGTISKKLKEPSFYESIVIAPELDGNFELDTSILSLTLQLFKGLYLDEYSIEWVKNHFYFDVRGFIFIPRTEYFTEEIKDALGKTAWMKFQKNQEQFDEYEAVGYRDFRVANREINDSLLVMIEKVLTNSKFPVFIGLAGPSAAGKTEFSYEFNELIQKLKLSLSVIEMDQYFLDRDYREKIGIGSMSRDSIHFDLLKKDLNKLKNGEPCFTPGYDFIDAVSSHDNQHKLKPGSSVNRIEPADVIFVEGNFPFLFQEISNYIDIKIFYLTDDPIRLKRKWKRDIDYRKKYNPVYMCNRYFRTQYLKAHTCYHKQLKNCDIAVDTTEACIWVSENMRKIVS